MKRSIATATGVVVLLAGAVGAQATANVDSGTYKGKVSKTNPDTGRKPVVTFKVTKSKKLNHFTHKGLYMKCSDGDHFNLQELDSGKKRLNIRDNGTFGFTVTYTNGGKWKVSGRIKGHKAHGTVKMTVRFNSDNNADPNGNILCTSGKRKWTAKH
jgi:hypothetical protein